MKAGYKPDYCFFRETLSGAYPTIEIHEHAKFQESITGPSDLVPSVTFLLPNLPGTEHLNNGRLLRVEF